MLQMHLSNMDYSRMHNVYTAYCKVLMLYQFIYLAVIWLMHSCEITQYIMHTQCGIVHAYNWSKGCAFMLYSDSAVCSMMVIHHVIPKMVMHTCFWYILLRS